MLATTDVTAPEWKLPRDTAIWPQGHGDLGHRLERILRRALETHPMAIAVGTDAPGLAVARLEAARDALRMSDATLPSDAVSLVLDAFLDPQVVAGAFRTHTIAEGQASWVARWLRLADLRSRCTRLPYGDQALFVRRVTSERLGGFPVQPLFEDLEMSRRLRRIGRIRTVPAAVRVSGRRFTARPFYYTILMNVLPALYRLGVPATRLARAYGDVR
ncbi:MAG: DUF2064 domain-containing protein [Acidobacteria bacterium]|nr:DUF2064 domain-containing protein [Acidobacteriota bacterium]